MRGVMVNVRIVRSGFGDYKGLAGVDSALDPYNRQGDMGIS